MSQSDKWAIVVMVFGCAISVGIGTRNGWLGFATFQFLVLLITLWDSGGARR